MVRFSQDQELETYILLIAGVSAPKKIIGITVFQQIKQVLFL